MTSFKNIVSVITLICFSLMVYNLTSISYETPEFIHSLLYGFFSVFAFIVILTYRISIIGKFKVNWLSLGLSILILISLILMERNKKLVYLLWDYTLIGYILLCGEALFQIIPKGKTLTLITKIFTAIILLFLVVIIVFNLKSPLMYSLILGLMTVFSVLLLVNFFLKTKNTN